MGLVLICCANEGEYDPNRNIRMKLKKLRDLVFIGFILGGLLTRILWIGIQYNRNQVKLKERNSQKDVAGFWRSISSLGSIGSNTLFPFCQFREFYSFIIFYLVKIKFDNSQLEIDCVI
jgi:hypothetical protein